MALLKSGSRGSAVTSLQEQLKAAGFDPGPIDGIYGSKTAAAVKAYQKANGLAVDGIAGPKTFASLNASNETGESTSSTGDASDNIGPRMSLAGNPVLWKVGNDYYIVHETTDLDGNPLRLTWKAPSYKDVESFFGPDQTVVVNQTLDALPDDVLMFGSTDELANMTEDPITTWRNELETQSKTQPWLLDADYQALSLMAVLEARPLTESEIQQTNWWKTHNEAQRQWMKVFHSDPKTAEQLIADNRIRTLDALKAAGINEPPESLVNYMADQLTTGEWSQTYFKNQIQAVADPAAGVAIDPGMDDLIEAPLDTTRAGEKEVRDLVLKWLGPTYGSWDDDLIADWAGRLRNDPDAELDLVEELKDQKMAMFPGYGREASYSTIAAPWKGFVYQSWGEQIDETDPLFTQIVNLNDAGEAGKLLTKEGLARGNDNVTNSVQMALNNSFGRTAYGR